MPNNPEDEYVALIQQHEGIIHKVIKLYVDDEEDKKDLRQEILLQAWKSFPRFKGHSSFGTWLYRVALNTVFSYTRTAKKRPESSMEIPEKPAEPAEPVEQHELLFRLIRQFDEVDRSLMTLHLDGYQNKEIAGILGLTVNHVNVKIHRLKAQIIKAFKNQQDGYSENVA